MKKIVTATALLLMLSSSSLFCNNNKDNPISPVGEKGVPIDAAGMPMRGKGMRIHAQECPMMKTHNTHLRKIKRLAERIQKNPTSAQNEKRAQEIVEMTDKLLQ